MYISDFGVQEVNAYYDRKGGMRTSHINNYANVGSFANLMRQAAARKSTGAPGTVAEESASAQTNATSQARSSQSDSAAAAASANAQTRARTYPRSTSQTAAGTHTGLHSNAATASALASHSSAAPHTAKGTKAADSSVSPLNAAQNNGNIYCEQCHETTQLMLQMMTKNLYTQSALGYPLTGVNAWTAYQSMAGMLGSSLFS